MDSGKLVPDTLVDRLLQERLHRDDCRKGFLLDGYPRNLSQARALESFLGAEKRRIAHAIYLEVQEGEVLRRLTGRRVCKCGAVFHLESAPPKRAGTCDACGSPLIHRDDDREDVILQRLNVYREQTEPLLQWFEGQGLLRRVPAVGGIEEIYERMETVLEEHGA
jgi:adenylate kinase